MAIYTSNYARKGNDPGAIAISAGPPKYYIGKRLPELAPDWDMVKAYRAELLTKNEYKERYIEILEQYDLDWYQWLDSCPDPTYFLCYESPEDFCHRRIFSGKPHLCSREE